MTAQHLWRGEWLDAGGADALRRKLETLPAALAPDLSQRPSLQVLLAAADALQRKLKTSSPAEPVRRELQVELQATGLSASEAEEVLRDIAEVLERSALEAKLLRELGSLDPFAPRRVKDETPVFEAWAPLGVLVHVAASNAPAVAPLSVLEGLLAGNINLLKTGSKNGLFPQKFLKALLAEAPGGALDRFVYVFEIPSAEKDLIALLLREADGIAAWGGDEATGAIRAMAPAGARVIEWGHRISFAYVSSGSLDNAEALDAIARDVCRIEQQACSSPQCICVDTEDRDALKRFAVGLAGTLGRVSPSIPRTEPGDAEAAEITTVRELADVGACLGEGEVLEAPDRSWRVLLNYSTGLSPSPLFRTVWVKPLPRVKILEALRPLRRYLQTVGLACRREELAELSRCLLCAGVTRVACPGAMLGSYPGEPHDGLYALERYCRRVAFMLDERVQGVANLAELGPYVPALPRPSVPVLDKAGFLARGGDLACAKLFVESGGSSGTPKLSGYSYLDYRVQMRAAADGLLAAGLDPARDRCMNLFAAGHLYGGFLSFFSILEHLGAVQFPMGMIDEYREVAAAIRQFNVNTILGMPGYLLRLFESEATVLGSYRGVKKIFYGGEHFNRTREEFLRREFGVEFIRSASYGSNDAGPLGHACPHCENGVHHLLSTQTLEILKTDRDEPVGPGETGRLVFSSRRHGTTDLLRYQIGDLGCWLGEPCPCGRTSPRFRLMGRLGDIFRIGTYFFNVRVFQQILSERTGYEGPLQLVLEERGRKEGIRACVQKGDRLESQALRTLLIAGIPELHDAVVNLDLLELELELIGEAEFKRSGTSGKISPVLDQRGEKKP